MSVYKKLAEARARLHKAPLKKSGRNNFAQYDYFELGDFLPETIQIFNEVGLVGVVEFFSDGSASLRIVDVDAPDQAVTFTSRVGAVSLKGCHDIQNLGAQQTYTRRYLWVMAMEIVESDAVDASPPVQNNHVPVKAQTIQAQDDLWAPYHQAAEEAANKGPEAYKSWFMGQPQDWRLVAATTQEHKKLKQRAVAAFAFGRSDTVFPTNA